MSSTQKKDEFADIDDKSKAVFKKKGYQLQCKLGQGAFGQVYKAVNFKRDNMVCAVKVMDLTKMPKKLVDKFLPRELAAMMEIKHPHIVRVYDIFKMSKKARMAHRDIKLDNILLNDENQVKLADFGFANLVTDETTDVYEAVSETYCGTVPYYSPQLVAKKPYNPFKADVWAMSCVLYAMLNNRFPFHFQDVKKLYKEQVDYPAFIRSRFLGPNTESARNLMELMFNPNEKDRPTMADVLQHEWILNKGKAH